MCIIWQDCYDTICFITYFDHIHAPTNLQQQIIQIGAPSFFSNGSKNLVRIVPELRPQQGGQVQGYQPQYILRYNSIQQQ